MRLIQQQTQLATQLDRSIQWLIESQQYINTQYNLLINFIYHHLAPKSYPCQTLYLEPLILPNKYPFNVIDLKKIYESLPECIYHPLTFFDIRIRESMTYFSDIIAGMLLSIKYIGR